MNRILIHTITSLGAHPGFHGPCGAGRRGGETGRWSRAIRRHNGVAMDVLSMLNLPFTTTIFYALPFLVALMVIVFVHEFGHFIVARWCGVKIEAFSIGFGKEIAGWHDRHGTRWKLSWLDSP